MAHQGPDDTSILVKKNVTFVHNLLSMTSDVWEFQPFVSADGLVVAMFTGEIYNSKTFGSFLGGGYSLISLYYKHGFRFVSLLDGEFSLVLFDFKKNVFLYATDVFATRPLWVSLHRHSLGLCTLASPLSALGFPSVDEVPANTAIARSLLPPFRLLGSHAVREFDLRQHKNSTRDWEAAFVRAVKKRVRDTQYVPFFVSLSGGHDSGAISLALHGLDRPHATLTIQGGEDVDVIDGRLRFLGSLAAPRYIEWNSGSSEENMERDHLIRNVEPYSANLYSPQLDRCRDIHPLMNDTSRDVREVYSLHADPASLARSIIARTARRSGLSLLLSGGGCDEIMTDHGLRGMPLHPQSCLRGIFPTDLSSVFPWTNFFKGTQRVGVRGEGAVCGSHGVAVRYPFLDPEVVQEYLWLAADVKNSAYKAPLKAWFDRVGFPYTEEKRGLVAKDGGVWGMLRWLLRLLWG